jgi:ABC-type proline/glycine betaine transport system permease subunit
VLNPIHTAGALLASVVNLNGSGHYVHWGFIQMSVANLVVIALMVLVFALAVAIPFRRRHGRDQ